MKTYRENVKRNKFGQIPTLVGIGRKITEFLQNFHDK